ncbi:hypothetical protein D9615_001433 [Tricholomella constricta]|uniref:Mitochondrial carrier protein n=1 Tax=Tricholomella constricta TaxID=117010 RepID=A0A8H5HL60_9AGAR|nr:hypothetical protein D9615_001433 [Tricholomella constricta]
MSIVSAQHHKHAPRTARVLTNSWIDCLLPSHRRMSENASQGGHLRIAGAFAGMGSGITKVAVGHGPDCNALLQEPIVEHLMFFPKYYGTSQGVFALYKGATPPAVGWAAIDSLLLGSLHNYRLFLLRHGMTETTPASGAPRLTLMAHGFAGLFAGWTSTLIATPIELLKGFSSIPNGHLPDMLMVFWSQASITVPKIIRCQGILGMWSGFTGSLAFRSNFFWMFLSFEALMRGFSRLAGTPYEISTGAANFVSGGLGAFAFWGMAIPADNVKK